MHQLKRLQALTHSVSGIRHRALNMAISAALLGGLSMSTQAQLFPPVIDLGSLSGSDGFRLDGESDSDYAGRVSNAGDINGDGIDDLIVGAPSRNDGAGSIYVVFGRDTGFDASLSLGSLNGGNGFRLDGVAAGEAAGRAISAAGDINGDGIGDLIIGAPNSNGYAGSSYVLFGRDTSSLGTFPAIVSLANLNGIIGFRLDGAALFDRAGRSVSGGGDINGDGIDDLIIGAYGADPNGINYAGSSYVVFGRRTGFSSPINLGNLTGADGFRLDGAAVGDVSGRSLSNAGDINGDGLDDLIIGADLASPNGNTLAGSSFVVFGSDAGFAPTVALGSLSGSDGFRLDGAAEFDFSGSSVAAAGDINGDGLDDLIVGASRASPNGNSSAGSSYVVFGRDTATTGNFPATLALSSLDGNNGFRLDGAMASDKSGVSVSAAGDINGDGIDDLLIGAPSADPNGISSAGSSYVMLGRDTANIGDFAPSINLGSLNGSNGFRLDGVAEFG